MKLSRREIRYLVESVINEEEKKKKNNQKSNQKKGKNKKKSNSNTELAAYVKNSLDAYRKTKFFKKISGNKVKKAEEKAKKILALINVGVARGKVQIPMKSLKRLLLPAYAALILVDIMQLDPYGLLGDILLACPSFMRACRRGVFGEKLQYFTAKNIKNLDLGFDPTDDQKSMRATIQEGYAYLKGLSGQTSDSFVRSLGAKGVDEDEIKKIVKEAENVDKTIKMFEFFAAAEDSPLLAGYGKEGLKVIAEAKVELEEEKKEKEEKEEKEKVEESLSRGSLYRKTHPKLITLLIESAEDDKPLSAVEYGLMNGVGVATYISYAWQAKGIAPAFVRNTIIQAFRSGSGVSVGRVLYTLGLGSARLGAITGSVLGVAGAAIAGYQIGSYIQDVMSGNTGTEEEKMLYSFKKSAKDYIGELGVKIFGFDIAPTWDTLTDSDYVEKAIEKGYKGLKPRDIDPGRLGELTAALVINRNFTKDGKLPRKLDELFAYRYLDAEAFKSFIEKKEKELINKLAENVNKEDVKKLANSEKADSGEDTQNSESGVVNESLSRGSLYRKRYYGRY